MAGGVVIYFPAASFLVWRPFLSKIIFLLPHPVTLRHRSPPRSFTQLFPWKMFFYKRLGPSFSGGEPMSELFTRDARPLSAGESVTPAANMISASGRPPNLLWYPSRPSPREELVHRFSSYFHHSWISASPGGYHSTIFLVMDRLAYFFPVTASWERFRRRVSRFFFCKPLQ